MGRRDVFAYVAIFMILVIQMPATEANVIKKLECSACKLLVKGVQNMFDKQYTQDEIARFVSTACILLKIQDKDVCIGAINVFREEVLTVFSHVALSPSLICSYLLNACPRTERFPLQPWNITIPPPPPERRERRDWEGAPTRTILHLTDVHWDPEYVEGTNADCGEPLCCRAHNGVGKGNMTAGKYGHILCDTPKITVEYMLATIANMTPPVNYVFWTGDLPPHDVWLSTRQRNLQVLKETTDMLKHYLPQAKVFGSMGNHEGDPVNSFPPPFVTGDASMAWLYDFAAVQWQQWLDEEAMKTLRYGGYYTMLLEPGIRVVSLQTNYCNKMSWWLIENDFDPAGQLQWLVGVLEQAERAAERVYLTGHIMPGMDDCLKSWSWNYYRIVDRFRDTIIAQFFGHSHDDKFTVFYDEETLSEPISVAFIGPSVTPYTNQYSGFKIFKSEGDILKEQHTYILDLSKANAGNPVWELEYSALEAYNMTDLSAKAFDKLIGDLASNDDLFAKFFLWVNKSLQLQCDLNCKKGYLCGLRTGRSHDPSFCVEHKNVRMTSSEWQDFYNNQPSGC
eukprot:Colp12_sorted_trinity150504_noHs@9361